MKITVKDIVSEVGPLPFRLVGKWAIQVCNALKSEMNIRGKNGFLPLSSSLILLNHNLDVQLDFPGSDWRSLAGTALTVSPSYWSPEQVRGDDLSIRSTLYSLGVVIYEMLTGDLPFSHPQRADILQDHLEKTPPRICLSRAKVPPTLDLIVVKLLSKDSSKRFDTPDEVAEIVSRMTLSEDIVGAEARKEIIERFSGKNGKPKIQTLSMRKRQTGSFASTQSEKRQTGSYTSTQSEKRQTGSYASTQSEKRQTGSRFAQEAGRITMQLKSAVYQGPPEWEKKLNLVAESQKVTLSWNTDSEQQYKCKVVKRGSKESYVAETEHHPTTSHFFEFPGLEPDTGYSATIFNEKDFVMKSFKTPATRV